MILTISLVIQDKVVMLVYPQHSRVDEPAGVTHEDVFIRGKQLDQCRTVTMKRHLKQSKQILELSQVSHIYTHNCLNGCDSAYMYIQGQGFTEDQNKIKKKTKTPRITDEGWNSQKQLSDPVEKKMKERKRRKKRLLYLHPKLSSGLVPL